MKSTSTMPEPVCMGSLIQPIGVTVFPLKLIKGESYAVRSLGFKFSPLYRLGYITSIAIPWSTNTLFTSNPLILSVTTKASLWGWMVPILSSSENPDTGEAPFLAFLDSRSLSLVQSRATNVLWKDKSLSFSKQQVWHLLCPWEVLRTCLFGAPSLLDLDDHWKDAKGASVSLLGLADPDGSKGSCNLL